MTVNTTARRAIGVGNGVTTVWPYAFLIPLANQLSVVYMNPNRDAIDPTGTGVVLNPASYAVTGIGNANGGTVTYPLAGSPVAAPVTITIVRTIPKTQPSTMANQGGAYPAAYEAALDNVEMQVQEISEIFLRTPSLPIGFDVQGQGVSLVLPPPTPSAMIAWDATGKFLQNVLSAAAVVIAPIVVGQIPFGAAGNALAFDGGLTWDNAGKRLITASVGAPVGTGLNLVSNNINQWQVQSAGHLMTLAGDNILDIGASGSNRPRTGYFGTSVVAPTLRSDTTSNNGVFFTTGATTNWSIINRADTANAFQIANGDPGAGTVFLNIHHTTGAVTMPSVVTPTLGTATAANLNFQINSAVKWAIDTNGVLFPATDNALNLGAPSGRIANIYTPSIDSGTTGPLVLRTNNGLAQLTLANSGLATFGNTAAANAFQAGSTRLADVANATFLEFSSGGRILVEGPSGGVRAAFNIVLADNVGGNALTPLSISAGGVVAISGTATNDNAASGQYGEYVSSTVVSGSSVALATGVTSNVASITLGAGDWDVSGCIAFTFGATTSYTNLAGGASSVTGTLGAQETTFDYETPATVPTAGKDMSWPIPTQRFSLSASTTIFLVAQGTFTVSTLKAYGIIRARRVR